tara:strand:+ start:29863 stop:30102 length:240 start_codon:yes stop_codon:yes gene_type:complete
MIPEMPDRHEVMHADVDLALLTDPTPAGGVYVDLEVSIRAFSLTSKIEMRLLHTLNGYARSCAPSTESSAQFHLSACEA